MAVGHGAAVAGHVLDHAHHPGPRQAIERRAAQGCHALRFLAQGAIADHVVRAGLPHIEQRQAIHADASFGQIDAQGLRIGARRLDRARGRHVIEPVERLASGIGNPDRRLHPRDAATFLIDRDQQPVAPVQVTQRIGQLSQLFARFDIAAEQDVAGRIGVLEKGALVGGENGAGKAENGWKHRRSFPAIRCL